MAPTTYSEVLARNVRAARSRADLGQASVAKRMTALGFPGWHPQTVSSTEKARRRVTAEEIFGLALALETSFRILLAPTADDNGIGLPGGSIASRSVRKLAEGFNDHAIRWDGDVPVFGQGATAWMVDEHPEIVLPASPQQPIAAAIVTSASDVLITERRDGMPPVGFVAGECEPGERPEDAAVREVKEETGLEVRTGDVIGERDHPHTGRHMIYLSAKPVRSLEVFVGDQSELSAVRWASVAEALELMPDMFGPVREYLEREVRCEMGRRSRGDGSVYFDTARGCWVGAVELGRDAQTGRRVRRKVSGATKTEVKDKLDELREEKHKSGTVARRDTTVERVIRDLLANPPRTWRSPVTIQVNTGHAERIIAAAGKTRMVRLTVADVERFLRKLADDGYSTSVIGATKRLGARAVRRAMRDGLAARNVFELAELQDGTRRQSRSMTLAEIRVLFASDLTPFWRAYLAVGICCGLRPGERTGLVWGDIDLAAGVIRVRHSLKALPGPDGHLVLQLAELKTEKSRRTLALPRYAVAALKALKTAQAADKLRLGPLYTDQGLVFCRADGAPYWREAIRLGFRRVCKLAGIGEDWTPRELRHSFVSVLSDAGVDIEDIADAAGHSSSTVTREVYRHQISDKVARAAEAMDRIFGAGGAS